MPFFFLPSDPVQLPPNADSTVIGFSTFDAPVVTLGHYVVGNKDTIWPGTPARQWRHDEEVFSFHKASVRAEILQGHRKLRMVRKDSPQNGLQHPIKTQHRHLLEMIHTHTASSDYLTAKTVYGGGHWWEQLPQGFTLPASSVTYSATIGGKAVYLSIEYTGSTPNRSLAVVRWLMQDDPANHGHRLPLDPSAGEWAFDPVSIPSVVGWYCETWDVRTDR